MTQIPRACSSYRRQTYVPNSRFLAALLGVWGLAATVSGFLRLGWSAMWSMVMAVTVSIYLLYAAVTGRSPEWLENLSRGRRSSPEDQ
jgi:hypothetical protein